MNSPLRLVSCVLKVCNVHDFSSVYNSLKLVNTKHVLAFRCTAFELFLYVKLCWHVWPLCSLSHISATFLRHRVKVKMCLETLADLGIPNLRHLRLKIYSCSSPQWSESLNVLENRCQTCFACAQQAQIPRLHQAVRLKKVSNVAKSVLMLEQKRKSNMYVIHFSFGCSSTCT